MGKQERERKARQRARAAAGGEAGVGGARASEGDAPSAPTAVSLFPENPSPGEYHNDTRLLARAVSERWASNNERRAAVRRKLQDAILNEKTTNPDTIAKLVTADARLESQNQRDDLAYDPFAGVTPPGGGSGEGDDSKPPTYQQINFYLPSNGRGQETPLNGHHGANGSGN